MYALSEQTPEEFYEMFDMSLYKVIFFLFHMYYIIFSFLFFSNVLYLRISLVCS